jgi:peroxiredoxin
MQTTLRLFAALALLTSASVGSASTPPEPLTVASADGVPTAAVGKTAPDFSLTDTEGKTVQLSSLRGKTVVLEWFNPGCPYVKYAHSKGPMPELTKTWTDKGVVWLAINSGAPGKQGHGLETNAEARKEWNMNYPVLLDESGTVGRMYGAKTTPHMYVIDAEGTLVYAGGLDNAPMGNASGKAADYVADCLQELAAGSAITTTTAKPYGCSVKYAAK